MIPMRLHPQKALLHEEYLLVQAWKKTASYIRYHNWFSDTLALDRAAANLPSFIAELRERVRAHDLWQNEPLRIVPAPKSQRWRVNPVSQAWEPIENDETASRLRPLAHVSLSDQVIASAVMLCLADRVETLQGDPRGSIHNQEFRKRILSYGNRLFCDSVNGELRHRWGSAKLYRTYYQDYRTFLTRPEIVAQSEGTQVGQRIFVIHADLRQFYDRVRPALLAAALERLRADGDDTEFFEFANSLLNWSWDPRDVHEVNIYAQQAGLADFDRVALPQGLVASGFFANIVLLLFDERLRRAIGTEIEPGMLVADACRYVDDVRVTILMDPQSESSSDQIKTSVYAWLNQLLKEDTVDLELSEAKTKIAAFGSEERPLVRQSTRMNRIQIAVSGGFDALAGEEILDALHGLMRAQEALTISDETGWRMTPVPDVRDETVARFGAARYRSTFRSIRPLLPTDETLDERQQNETTTGSGGRARVARTRRELDDDSRTFALSLIQRWVADPSNVRLLRIGLDLYPDASVLRGVLNLLQPYTESGSWSQAPKRIAWYCLAEILRAGATETGLVEDNECLPADIYLRDYRVILRDEAVRLVSLPWPTIPWYLRQQALLFLAAFDPTSAPIVRPGTAPETKQYRELVLFLRGDADRLRRSDFAILAILARRTFVDRAQAIQLVKQNLGPSVLQEIAAKDPAFISEIIATGDAGKLPSEIPARVREDFCMDIRSPRGDFEVLADIVLSEHPTGSLRNELGLLHFAIAFLREWQQQASPPEVITPGFILMKRSDGAGNLEIKDLRILKSRTHPAGSLYQPPEWCAVGEQWRFQLGFLLRFILSGQSDFTSPVRPTHWKESESVYRPFENHWYQRLYGLFNGQQAFGDDWLPITEWVELLLLVLLRWPGCRIPEGFEWIENGIDEAIGKIEARIHFVDQHRGQATGALLLPLVVRQPISQQVNRPLRVCVIQTAVPNEHDFSDRDLTLSEPLVRGRHRNHLSAALAAVERMLVLRDTHKSRAGRLDWLILPELAVHPSDVRSHLIPFARAHRTMILTGLTYQQLIAGQPLVNSALWIIPEWSDANGLQIKIRRQGKAHLAPVELALNSAATQLQGFRPCQWIIGYPWSNDELPMWLTAAICYDATDLGLAADLRDVSDVFAIPALNKDIQTFDNMALALHYHMFQLVILANNGEYGGSNAYWPHKDVPDQQVFRQVFHMHGQPQATIAFLEIDDIAAYLERHSKAAARIDNWKYPPAGLKG